MQLTREVLEANKAEAIGLRNNLAVRLERANGAIDTLDHLLALLDRPETAPVPAPPPAAEPPQAALHRPCSPPATPLHRSC